MSDLRAWAVKGAEQRLVEIAEEAKAVFASFPELRAQGRGFMSAGGGGVTGAGSELSPRQTRTPQADHVSRCPQAYRRRAARTVGEAESGPPEWTGYDGRCALTEACGCSTGPQEAIERRANATNFPATANCHSTATASAPFNCHSCHHHPLGWQMAVRVSPGEGLSVLFVYFRALTSAFRKPNTRFGPLLFFVYFAGIRSNFCDPS